jgi:hypothetical protein
MKSLKLEHGVKNFRESGQGILEYSVIIVLVVIIIISFVALFGVDLFNRFMSNRARASEEQSSPEPIVNLYETGTQMEAIETENIRMSNCPTGEPYNPEIERVLWMEYDIDIDGQMPGSLRPLSITSIQAYYGFHLGDREERVFLLNLEAPPNSIVEYTIQWQSVWKEGEVHIVEGDMTQQSLSYRAEVDLDYEITDIEQYPCESTPIP